MRVIGIAGGVASGKSQVSRMFQDLGAGVLDADQVGHDVLKQAEIKQKILQQWGDIVFTDGEVNRSELAKRVFGPQPSHHDQLKKLEQITHPEIGRRLESRLAEMRKLKQYDVVVLDAPVMFKAGWHELCDEIVFVDVELATRVERAAISRGWSADELSKREALQIPLEKKKKRATVFVDNSGEIADTFQQVIAIWSDWGLPVPDEVQPPTH